MRASIYTHTKRVRLPGWFLLPTPCSLMMWVPARLISWSPQRWNCVVWVSLKRIFLWFRTTLLDNGKRFFCRCILQKNRLPLSNNVVRNHKKILLRDTHTTQFHRCGDHDISLAGTHIMSEQGVGSKNHPGNRTLLVCV